MSATLVLIFELLGTVAFAASGAITAISKKMDIFGVATLGVITAVGGGVIRDLVLGRTPPATFSNPVYTLVAVGVSVVMFIPAVRKFIVRNHRAYEMIMLIMDSLGLGIFTVVGIETAYLDSENHTPFLVLFVGMVTGIGGGVLRDLLSKSTPFVFKKYFYASASLIGGIVCVVLWHFADHSVAMSCGAMIIIILRLLAARFHWSLPKPETDTDI